MNSDAPSDDRLPPHLVRVAILAEAPSRAAAFAEVFGVSAGLSAITIASAWLLVGAGPPAEPQDNDITASESEPRRSS